MTNTFETGQGINPIGEKKRINRGNLTGTETTRPDGIRVIAWDPQARSVRVGTERTTSRSGRATSISQKPGTRSK